jgi:EmrB/QacA subfamily drug resistance transporter
VSHKRGALLSVCLASFVLLVDITIVQVALPTIQRDLHASLTGLQWVIDAYAVTLAAVLLTAGILADRYGRRLAFVIGVAIFALASALCAVAGSSVELNLARALQGGLGAAAMFATSLALIAQEFPGPDRASAIAAWGATVGAAVAVGPLLGGLLTDGPGWQWIFLVNVPVGALTIALALTCLGESHDPAAARLDMVGLIAFSGALFLLVFGPLRGNAQGWSDPTIIAGLAGSGVLIVCFVVIELRVRCPMLDLSLFRRPSFSGVSLATFAIAAGMFAMFLYISLYLQNGLGYSPLQGGLRMLPLSGAVLVIPLVTRRLTASLPPRIPLGAGLALVGIGLLLMSGIDARSRWTALLAGEIVAGSGIGLANPAIASTALAVVPAARSGMASGISNTFRLSGPRRGNRGARRSLPARGQGANACAGASLRTNGRRRPLSGRSTRSCRGRPSAGPCLRWDRRPPGVRAGLREDLDDRRSDRPGRVDVCLGTGARPGPRAA